MDSKWQKLLNGKVLLDECKWFDSGRAGALIANDQGIVFRDGKLTIEWGEILYITPPDLSKTKKSSLVVRVKNRYERFYTKSITPAQAKVFQQLQILYEAWESEMEKQRAAEEADDFVSVTFPNSGYLGGLTKIPDAISGEVHINLRGFYVAKELIVAWAEVQGLLVESEQVAKSKVAATIMFGVLGAAGAKGTRQQSVISAKKKDKQTAYFLINDLSSQMVKAKLGPVMASKKVQMLGESSSPALTDEGLVGELEKLAKLKDSGVLTASEFQKAKKKLLG